MAQPPFPPYFLTDIERALVDKRVDALELGAQLLVPLDGHRYLVMATSVFGIPSLRRRYLLACLTCMTLVHEATNGVTWHIERHRAGDSE